MWRSKTSGWCLTASFYAGGSTIESIDALDAQKLFIFHINDEKIAARAVGMIVTLAAGLGILPLQKIIAALRRINYDRAVSVEIFRPEYWERPPRSGRGATPQPLEFSPARIDRERRWTKLNRNYRRRLHRRSSRARARRR